MEPSRPDPVVAMAERLAQVEARLDDVTRQRVLGRIQQALADEERARVRRRHWHVVASAIAAALVVAASWTLLRAPRAARTASSRSATQQKPASAPIDSAALSPFLVAGMNGERAAQLLARAHTELSLHAGERMWAQLDQRARLALVGPVRVRLRALAADDLLLELEEGTLLGEYDHARGGRLSIRSPDAVTDVVGTVFLVQASAGRTRVAVAEGAVRVQRGDKRLSVKRNEALSADADAPAELSLTDRAALREHGDGFVPAAGVHGILGITGPRLRASVAGRSLGETPLWVRMPIGAHTIELSGPDGSQREVKATVRGEQQTDLVVPVVATGADPTPLQALSGDARRGTKMTPVPGPKELYREAETAMREAQLERASALLARLVQEYPRAPSVDLARYELAELALRTQDYGSARRWLAQLAQHGTRPALEEPAAFLRCQSLGPDRRAPSYMSCIEALRARFPDSPHLRSVP